VFDGLSCDALADIAAEAGARGILLDTARKEGPGLAALWDRATLARWVARARGNGLLVALAGKLGADDLAFAADAGPDIVGVRGAACDGGRNGTIDEARVRLLVTSLRNLQMDRAGSAVR
jgi:uncharacterized protein (UPF0264 family)